MVSLSDLNCPDQESDNMEASISPDFRWTPSAKKCYSIHSKCDQIQYPPPGEFDSACLEWYGTLGNSAWIPEDRLNDFMWGENMRDSFHTQFIVERSAKHKPNGIGPVVKTVTTYNCCFGPEDMRHWKDSVGNKVPIELKTKAGGVYLKQKCITGQSIKRGCRCRFTVIAFAERKGCVLIRWLHKDHLDKNSLICHGLDDTTSYSSNCHISPRLSLKLRAKIERYLRAGLSPKAIIQAHFEEVAQKWRTEHPDSDSNAIFSRDMQLTPKDVWTVRESMRRRQPFYTTDDATGVHHWVLQNEADVLVYQSQLKAHDQTFILCWSTEWQLKKLASLGHNGAVAFDATFGTNHCGFPFYTVVVFDEFQNAIPVCFSILQRYRTEEVTQVLTAVKEAATAKREVLKLPGIWKPNCWIIDVADEEQKAIENVFPNMPITFCTWHVRRAWTKNIISKVSCPFAKAQINEDLGALMYSNSTDMLAESQAFVDKWIETQAIFVTYYTREWHKKITRWAVNLRLFRHANQNTNGGIERWHHTLKVELKAEKNSIRGRSLPWLIERLKFIENHYWCMSAAKFQGRLRNRVVEKHVHKCLNRARQIPDDHVTQFQSGSSKCASVKSVSQKSPVLKEHLVTNWDTDSCSCTCGYSLKGNACKHQIKVLLMTGVTDLDLLTQVGTKNGTFCGGLNNMFRSQAGELPPMTNLADVTLITTDDDIWDDPGDEPNMPDVSPPIEEFFSIVRMAYESITNRPDLARQGLKELKNWNESLKNREARQNVTLLESQHSPIESLTPDAASDFTTVRKLGWVDKLMMGRQSSRRKSGHSSVPKRKVDGIHVTPEKLEIKRREKAASFQASFDKQAMDALQDMLDSVTDKENQATPKNQSSPGVTAQGKAHGKKVARPRAPRKSRSAAPFPLKNVVDLGSQSTVLSQPLTPSQAEVIGGVRFGSSQAWAMSPNFSTLLEAFSAGAIGRGKTKHTLPQQSSQRQEFVSIIDD